MIVKEVVRRKIEAVFRACVEGWEARKWLSVWIPEKEYSCD